MYGAPFVSKLSVHKIDRLMDAYNINLFLRMRKHSSRMLMFLAKLLTSKSNSSSVRIFHTMVSKGDVFKISLVQQCKELVVKYNTHGRFQKKWPTSK